MKGNGEAPAAPPDPGEDRRLQSIWETLQTARRTHVALLLATVAVMVAAAPFGPDVGKALEEIRVLREYPQMAQFDRWCHGLAERKSAESLAGIREAAGLPDVRSSRLPIHCPRPAAEWTLERHLDFLTNQIWIQILTVDPEIAAAVVGEAMRQQEGPPEWLFISGIDLPRPLERTFTELAAQDDRPLEARISLAWRGWADTPESVGPRFYHADTVPAVVERIRTPRTPRRWLADEHPVMAAIVIDSVFDEQRLLPALTQSWEEVRTMTLDEAAQYLRGTGEGQGSVEAFGLRLDTEALAWGGPTVLLFLLVYLLLHLQHLDHIGGDEVLTFRVFPWFTLFRSGSARVTAVLTLWALPVAAGVLVTWRVVETGPITTVWAAGVTLLVASVGWRVLRELARVRARVVRLEGAADPGGAARPEVSEGLLIPEP